MRGVGGTPALDKTPDFQQPDRAVERHRNDIAGADLATWGGDPSAIDTDIAGIRQCRCRAAGAHQPGVPEPPVDALAVFGGHFSGAPWRRPRAGPSRRRVLQTANSDQALFRARGDRIAVDGAVAPDRVRAAGDRTVARVWAGDVGAGDVSRVADRRRHPPRLAAKPRWVLRRRRHWPRPAVVARPAPRPCGGPLHGA